MGLNARSTREDNEEKHQKRRKSREWGEMHKERLPKKLYKEFEKTSFIIIRLPK